MREIINRPIFLKILYHLYHLTVIDDKQKDITDFLFDISRDSDPVEQTNKENRVEYALILLQKNEFIGYTKRIEIDKESKRKLILRNSGPTGFIIEAGMTFKGFDYILSDERQQRASVVNDSLKNSATAQKYASYVLAIAAGLTLLLAILDHLPKCH